MIAVNPLTIIEGLQGIESVLSNPLIENGKLSYLVAVDANRDLPDPADEGAREWLREVAEMIREAMGDKAPPRVSEQVHA